MKNRLARISIQICSLVVLLAMSLTACTFSLVDLTGLLPGTATPPYPLPPTPTPQPVAEISFEVALPTPLLPGESLAVSILDEVTGLALNPIYYPMTGMDALRYRAVIPFAINSVVKYRYVRLSGLPIMEDDSGDRPVRYRMVLVSGPGLVQDIVASWSDTPFTGGTGRISGQVTDSNSSAALPNLLIAVGGQQTLTDSTGAFIVEGLPPGTHNLVAYALDGMYATFQQGARVEAGRRTPVQFSLQPAPLVNVIFTVIVPQDTVPSAPLRFAGNLYQLGNTFSDLNGGLSTVATRMPVLTPLQDGRYMLSISLPAGADLRYKYTMGDGFWNAEHRTDGAFVVRQLVVPSGQGSVMVEDVIATWQAGPSAPILFEVTVPETTPVGDIVSIQFNPYGWTEPLPMWPLGNNRWVYKLFSPLNMLGQFEYRYCRNDQCGTADDVATAGNHRGRPVGTSLTPQNLQDSVTAWTWMEVAPPGTLVGSPVTGRGAGFWAGVEFQPDYDPSWQFWMTSAVQNIQAIGSNWLVISPTWTVGRTAPFVFSPVPGHDPLWVDTTDTVNRARAANLNVALFPTPRLPMAVSDWWMSTPRDGTWWDAWFNRYQAYVLYHADLAARSGAGALILGGEWVSPALPNGKLPDGHSSSVPADAEQRWRSLLAETRQRYPGSIFWAIPYPGGFEAVPVFLSDLDGIYMPWSAPLSGSVLEMQAQAGALLDGDVHTFESTTQKPLVIALAYPSDNMQAQADVYQAMLAAVNERPWVDGFVSRGYYPPAALQDASTSIHGKPAADILWYWYPRLLGVVR